jgi:argininosuccinate synthase
LPQKAVATGASKIFIEDLTEEFAGDYLFKLLRSGAIYEGKYLLGTSIARPLIAQHMVKVAQKEGADAIAHGCTGKGNDQVRFELTVMALDPSLKVIAPWREWDITSREDALAYAAAHNIPVSSSLKSIYSRDRNLWHLSHEGGILEDTWNEADEAMYQLSVSPEEAPDQPEYLELEFEQGYPMKLNGTAYTPANLVTELNEIGGKHGIGRVDMVENRLVGMKSRGVYETPGGTILLPHTRIWNPFALIAIRSITSSWLHSATRNWFITASGSLPCAKQWMPHRCNSKTHDWHSKIEII